MGSCNSTIQRRNCKLDKGRLTRNGQENTKTANCISVHAPTGRCRQTVLEEKRRNWGLISIENCISIEKNSLGYYINTKQEQLLKEVCKENIIKERQNQEEKKKLIIENRKERFGEKPLHSAYSKDTKDGKDIKESWK